MFHKTQNMIASGLAVGAAIAIVAVAGAQFLDQRTGSIGLLVVAQGAVAAAVFFSTVLAKVGDRETLSVYNEMRRSS